MSDNQFKDLNPHTPSIATAIYKVGNATLSMTWTRIKCNYDTNLYASSGTD